ncbi:MAG: SulP family inorganic anion transporter [Gammaproteobacteria bacterium]
MHKAMLRLLPFLAWRTGLNRQIVRADLVAGATGAIVVLPQGVAFAAIAGMPPQYGLYAAMVPAIVAALFGSSRHLVSGPTTAASLVLFSVLSALAEPGTSEYIRLALTLTFMVGMVELAMGLARLGFLTTFISHSVVIGFTAGAAILIASNQLTHFLGLQIPSGLHFYETLFYAFQHLADIQPYVMVVGVSTLITGIVFKRYLPRVPYLLAALIAGSLAATWLNEMLGQAVTHIETVGALPATLPPLSAPDFSLSTMKALAPAVLAVTLFALTEAVSISRSLAVRSGQVINGSQEFIGQGLSNIVGSFFSAYVATGSFNRSAVNYESGAKTSLAAVFAGALLVLVVILVAPLLGYLPHAAMAGILFLVAWGLIDIHHIRRTLLASRGDSVVLGATFFGTLFLELEFAILLGVMLSLVVYLARTSRPSIRVRVPNPRDPRRQFTSDPTLPECPQLKLVRIDGSLFFGAVDYVRERLRRLARENPEQKHLLILARSINFVDVAGAELLAEEAKERRAMGGRLYLHQVKEVTCETLKRGGYREEIGPENVFASKHEAIATIFTRLDKAICARCDKRIFTECASVVPIRPQNASGNRLKGCEKTCYTTR